MKQIAEIRQAMPAVTVDLVEDTPFVTLDREPDLARFFRYWNKARKSAMRPHGV
jgi:hypothetical protein